MNRSIRVYKNAKRNELRFALSILFFFNLTKTSYSNQSLFQAIVRFESNVLVNQSFFLVISSLSLTRLSISSSKVLMSLN